METMSLLRSTTQSKKKLSEHQTIQSLYRIGILIIVDPTICDLIKICGVKHWIGKVIGIIAGITVNVFLLMMSDKALICNILSHLINNCIIIPSSYFKLIMGVAIFKKIIDAIKEYVTESDRIEREKQAEQKWQALIESIKENHLQVMAELVRPNGESFRRYSMDVLQNSDY